jgi:hypothetical protein
VAQTIEHASGGGDGGGGVERSADAAMLLDELCEKQKTLSALLPRVAAQRTALAEARESLEAERARLGVLREASAALMRRHGLVADDAAAEDADAAATGDDVVRDGTTVTLDELCARTEAAHRAVGLARRRTGVLRHEIASLQNAVIERREKQKRIETLRRAHAAATAELEAVQDAAHKREKYEATITTQEQVIRRLQALSRSRGIDTAEPQARDLAAELQRQRRTNERLRENADPGRNPVVVALRRERDMLRIRLTDSALRHMDNGSGFANGAAAAAAADDDDDAAVVDIDGNGGGDGRRDPETAAVLRRAEELKSRNDVVERKLRERNQPGGGHGCVFFALFFLCFF